MIGRSISHYKITDKLGEGGMGVVYKAEDTKLDRAVALKFLAAHLVSDEDVRKRFEREAKAAAALNHPNICTVHSIDEFEGKTFIAMAFLEGEGLDKKIEAGPLKLKDALDIAIQTAQGLQAAHEKKIVHRDIKPANLMVTGSGSKQLVTIMDFGLAQLADRSKLTRMDETMGTVTYMSPEQTYGADIDHRSDIWSLGVVIYEMVTGQQPFKGHYDKAVMYSITSEQPEPMTGLRTGVPMELELLVNKCLAKDAEERYQHTDELLLDLQGLRKKLESGRSTIMHAVPATSQQSAGTRAQHAVPLHSGMEVSEHPLVKYRVIEDIKEPDDAVKYLAEDTELHRSVAIRVLPQSSADQIERAQRRKQTVAFGVGALGALLALVFAFFPLLSPAPEPERPVRRFTLTTDTAPVRASISPNGRHVAYVTGSQGGLILWVQDLDQNQPRSIVGPGGIVGVIPSWSPDSEFICFRSGNELKKVAVSGGPAVTVCEVSGFTFATRWTPDGDSIVFHMDQQLHKVSAGGGKPEPWLESQQEGLSALSPAFFSPETGIEKLLYEERMPADNTQIISLDRVSGQREILAEGLRPVYAPSGHVIYQTVDPAGIWAVPFSVDTMKATGNPFSIGENGGYPSIAGDGTLVYLEGPVVTRLARLVWLDREGNHLGTIGQPQNTITNPALSPDGKSVAVMGRQGEERDIWIHEVNRPVKTRLTAESGNDVWPTWSPAGDRIAFASARTGERDIYVRRADGSGEASPLFLTEDTAEYLTDWSRDEKTLLFWRRPHGDATSSGGNIFYLRRKDDGSYEEMPFLTTEFEETTARFSPDERFIAYVSDESGQREIYIQAFPQGGNRRRVSLNGGSQPRWRADGKELFYVEGNALMAVPVSTSPALTVGSPEELFSAPSLRLAGSYSSYDVTPEGNKFVIWESVEADTGTDSQPVIRVVQNWYEEFRDRE
jgi:Tol biopolymer transport system component/predicted Ser/Thr protein kinase